MNYLYPLNAIHVGGDVILLYTLDEVHDFIRKYGQWYDHHVEYHYDSAFYRHTRARRNNWIVRDDRGRKVKYDDVSIKLPAYYYWNKNCAKRRAYAEKGLPIPGTGCSKAGYKMNHPAKKNSGSGHRNRNRAKAIYEAEIYKVKNNVGTRVIPWEGC